MLLEKMSKIMKKNSQYSTNSLAQGLPMAKSLNKDVRKQELLKITVQN